MVKEVIILLLNVVNKLLFPLQTVFCIPNPPVFFLSFSSVCSDQILLRLSKLCVQEGLSGRKSKKQQQRLLRNMGAHAVVLELLQIPYEKVTRALL